MEDLALLVHSEEVDVLCIQEVNNVMTRETRGALWNVMQGWHRDSFVAVSTLSDRPRKSDYQHGGTMTVIMGDSHRVGKSMGYERMGTNYVWKDSTFNECWSEVHIILSFHDLA